MKLELYLQCSEKSASAFVDSASIYVRVSCCLRGMSPDKEETVLRNSCVFQNKTRVGQQIGEIRRSGMKSWQ